MITIEFIDETGKTVEEQITVWKNLIQTAADMEAVTDNAEVSITFVTNERIHEINKEYRGIDRPTDVISFALEEQTEGEIPVIGEEIPIILGDIIVSIPKAEEQAREYDHSIDREMGFLLVHGFLHLLGYDHINEADEKKMFKRQEDILQRFGLTR